MRPRARAARPRPRARPATRDLCRAGAGQRRLRVSGARPDWPAPACRDASCHGAPFALRAFPRRGSDPRLGGPARSRSGFRRRRGASAGCSRGPTGVLATHLRRPHYDTLLPGCVTPIIRSAEVSKPKSTSACAPSVAKPWPGPTAGADSRLRHPPTCRRYSSRPADKGARLGAKRATRRDRGARRIAEDAPERLPHQVARHRLALGEEFRRLRCSRSRR